MIITTESEKTKPLRFRNSPNGFRSDEWWAVSCPCRFDGPWLVLGPRTDNFACARCSAIMHRRPSRPDDQLSLF